MLRISRRYISASTSPTRVLWGIVINGAVMTSFTGVSFVLISLVANRFSTSRSVKSSVGFSGRGDHPCTGSVFVHQADGLIDGQRLVNRGRRLAGDTRHGFCFAHSLPQLDGEFENPAHGDDANDFSPPPTHQAMSVPATIHLGERLNDMGFFAHRVDRGRHDLFDRRVFGVDLCDYDSS